MCLKVSVWLLLSASFDISHWKIPHSSEIFPHTRIDGYWNCKRARENCPTGRASEAWNEQLYSRYFILQCHILLNWLSLQKSLGKWMLVCRCAYTRKHSRTKSFLKASTADYNSKIYMCQIGNGCKMYVYIKYAF